MLEWALLLLATPFLLFPSVYPRLAAGALAAVGLAIVAVTAVDWKRVGLWEVAGLLQLPWAMITVWTVVGAMVSQTPDLTLPKFTGIALGMLMLRVVLLTGTTLSRIWWLAAGYFVAGTAMVIGGMLAGPRWLNKFDLLYYLDGLIPRVVLGMPGAEGGVNSTALGGSTLWLLPVATVLALYGLMLTVRGRSTGDDRRWSLPATMGCAAAALAAGFVLLLSQARAAWMAVPVTAFLVFVIRSRRAIGWWVLGAVSAVMAWAYVAQWSLVRIFGPERPFIWGLAAALIRSHPLAGAGLGSFRLLAGPAPEAGIPEPLFVAHAHNVFLQVALDVGIPGLIGYLGLLGLATYMTRRMLQREGHGAARALCAGLWANLVAIHLFGLVDAIGLGTKVGVFFWWNLGLIAALHNEANKSQTRG